MPKGRGSNLRRANRRTQRRNGGFQGGKRFAAGQEAKERHRANLMAPGVWRLRPVVGVSYSKPGFFRRLGTSMRRFGLKVEASVAPSRATKRLESEIARRGSMLQQSHNVTAMPQRRRTQGTRRR